MALDKGKTEGGSGGKRGHSNMEHWDHTEDIKESTKKVRRLKGKAEIKDSLNNDGQSNEK